MRTKHILTALVFPAIFAACTADDFNETISNGATAERALLSEDFKLYFDDATTRFSAGEPGEGLSFSYEVGDSIGGAIVDSYSIVGNEEKFEVVNYVSTNHPFVLNADGVWAINHTMVEGHYLFYFPYNQANHTRGAVRYSIPVMQDLSGEDGKFNPKAAVERYNMGVGAQFLDKEDLSASVQLINIFGYAKIKVMLDNRYAGGYVDKIVLQAENGKSFALNGQIANKKVSPLFDKLEDSQEDYEAALKTAIAAMNNSWVKTTVYEKKAADAKLEEIVDGSSNKITDGFVTYISGIYAATIEGKDRPLWLSAKDYVKVESVPAYSYIETYETANVYKAVALWIEASTKYVNEDWFGTTLGPAKYKYNSSTTTNNTMSNLKNFFNEINMVNTENNLLLQQELKPIKDMVATVITWNYTDKQIEKLGTIVDK